MQDNIMIIGSSGQIGSELTMTLRSLYSSHQVLATDIREEGLITKGTGPFEILNVLEKERLAEVIRKYKITQIYMLAAILSARGEMHPLQAWNINMTGLLNVLEGSVELGVKKVFWPSSIAVFGITSPKDNCPQSTVIEPTTVYGISKIAGESWCDYYHQKHQLDIRSVRYPGLISYKTLPGGGTTDYAIDIFHKALQLGYYESYIDKDVYLPMMYMPDALRATVELMDAPADKLSLHRSYNLSGISFSPKEIAAEIKKHIRNFEISYKPDYRNEIALTWPHSIDDSVAERDWNWKPEFNLAKMTTDMLEKLRK